MATSDQFERDEDRLPWLETVEPDEPHRSGGGRIVLLVLLAMLILGGVIFGLYRLQAGRGADGSGELIAAQEGDYKIKPEDPGGLKVDGEGDAAIATSAGANPNGSIDLKAVPEAPISGTRRAVPAAQNHAGAASASVAVPAATAPLRAQRPMSAPVAAVPGAGSGGSLVQLGAFPSEATANAAWSAVAKRFSYVAPLGKDVQKAEVNGRTVYRLRVNAGSANAAADICGRLKVAGESCFVTS
ncbi:SPOR domain-containing protein [Sphingomonas sp. RHCKR47]|uniref:SPOR domain-containing protein n=1 Tax=Sphingomonas citricola TaxID=2862498 RepID=UPI001C67F753|nr:SPOR domain-containing protein [Sphingomonas citricola]MBW6523315.1 SPOR domain-containing protein [Sphingomonas citricola]